MNQSIEDEAGPEEELSAREAAAMLGVKLPTLYAYVSRGQLRSLPGRGNARARRYLRRDVEALLDRSRGSAAAASALRFGEPVLASSISEITERGPAYRGHLAVELVREGAAFEAAAELLWGAAYPLEVSEAQLAEAWAAPSRRPRFASLVELLPERCPPASVRPLGLAAWASGDPGRFDPAAASVLPRARAAARLLAALLAIPHSAERARRAWKQPSIAAVVCTAYGLRKTPERLRALDAMLVLLADHELNASTFAARVAASARADVYAALQAGLAALSGPLHGGASDQVEALLLETRSAAEADAVVHERARRGELLPGFGHPLYRDDAGDPRAQALLEIALAQPAPPREAERMFALLRAATASHKPAANVDAAAVALRAAIGLPAGAVAGIFAVGRSAGWVAHILEQYDADQLLRPRARYIGTPTAAGGHPA